MYGPERFFKELRDLGHEVQEFRTSDGTLFAVVTPFLIECGRFTGRVIDLGLHATADFPRTVASAIHVRSSPHLYDVADSIKQVRNIKNSVLGQDWRYWSHNFGWQGERCARRLMSQINGIFLHAS